MEFNATAAALSSGQETVKQTIVETVEAPRLSDISTVDFVKFKTARENYERIICEKNEDPNVNIPLTTYKSSIAAPIQKLFILANWVPAATVDEITEDQLKTCVKKRAVVDPVDYDLALLDGELKDVKMDRKKGTLVNQTWGLVLLYMRTLEGCGYHKFVEEQPKLAVRHIMKRVEHRGLRTRMLLTLKLRENEMLGNFQRFVRELSKEAENIDRMDSARRCNINDIIASDTEGASFDYRRQDGKKNGEGRKLAKVQGKQERQGKSDKKRNRDFPDCLNKKCAGKHFIDQCPITGKEEAKALKKAYFDERKKRKTDDGKRGIQSLSYTKKHENSSLFNATFCNGAIDCLVLADSGSDCNAMSKQLFQLLLKEDPSARVTRLDKKITLRNANVHAEPIICSRSVAADVELNIRHGGKLLIRRVEWLVSEQELAYAYIGRELLDALGINNQSLMDAVRDKYGDSIDADQLPPIELEKNILQEKNNSKLICSMSKPRNAEYGSTFHSSGGCEDDSLDGSDIYIDLGEDDPLELEEYLIKLVKDSAENGLSSKGQEKLKSILSRHKNIFRIRLGKSEPAKVPPMHIRLKPNSNPVKVRSRRYDTEKRKFLDKYVQKLIDMDFWTEMPTADWQAAPLIVPKPGSNAKWRFTVDTRPVNASTVEESWPMPHIEAEINDFRGSKCFASLDFVSGYWQLPLAEQSWNKCGVVTPTGVCASKRVLPGLTNAGAHFQRSVEPCFAELREHLKAWLDDFSLHAENEYKLLQVLERFFEICSEKNLQLSAKKSVLFCKNMNWCGRIITPDGYKMDPRRLEGLKDMSEPRTADELAEFVYCARWMSNSIPDFAKRVAPLVEVLESAFKKSGRRTKRSIKKYNLGDLSWGTTHSKAFEYIQESLRKTVKMAYMDPDRVTCVFTDASDKHWSGVVTQTHPAELKKPVDEQSHEPLAFLGSAFRGPQLHWSTFEKEAFAIFQTFDRMDYMLLAKGPAHVFTDHRNLLFVFAPLVVEPSLGRHIVSKVQRWALYLSRFSYVIEHISGKDNVCADMLTRWTRGHRGEQRSMMMCSLSLKNAEQLMPRPQDFVWPDVNVFRTSQRKAPTKSAGLTLDDKDDLWKKDGCIWVPENDRELRMKVVVVSHGGTMGHRGQDATLSTIKESFWWNGMDEEVAKVVGGCLHCLVSRSGGLVPRPLGTAIHGTRPNEVIHMDYLYMGPSTRGASYLLLIKDDFSSFVWLWPSESPDSVSAADALATWMGSFGCMKRIVTDQGTHFKNKLISELTKDTRTSHHFTTAYTPWANGTVERVCREVLRASRALLSEWKLAERDWPAVSECVQGIINSAPLKRLGRRKDSPNGVFRSPLEVFTGHTPARPLIRALPVTEFPTASNIEEIEARKLTEVEKLQDALREMHRDVHGLISKSRRRRIDKHNARTNISQPNFNEGDWVLVRTARKSHHKLSFVWKGPKRITGCRSSLVYDVEDMNGSRNETVHARRLIMYRADMDGKPVTKDLLDASEHLSTKYEAVESIQSISEIRGDLHVQIQWEGLPDETDWTWEPLQQAYTDVQEMVEEYLETPKQRKLKEKAKRLLRIN